MPGPTCSTLPTLLAQAAQGGGDDGALSPMMVLLVQFGPVLLLAFFLFFWLPMRNQRKRMDMIHALKKNDRVLTESGIYGTVVSIDEKADKVVLRIDDDKGVRLTCRKTSIVGVVDGGNRSETAEKKAS
jgi:preprotein translocase subunit YajC